MTEIPSHYGQEPSTDFEAQYFRVFEAAGCKTQVELASFLEITQSSISDAKKRKSIPPDWLLKLLDKKWINPGWIRSGLGNKTIRTKSTPSPVNKLSRHQILSAFTTEQLLAEIAYRIKGLMPPTT